MRIRKVQERGRLTAVWGLRTIALTGCVPSPQIEVRRSILVRFSSNAQRAGAAELSDPCRRHMDAASKYCAFSPLRTQTDAYRPYGYL